MRGKQVRKPGGIFYTPATGIWQSVWMEPVPKTAYIAGIQITPDADKGWVHVRVDTVGSVSHATVVVAGSDKKMRSTVNDCDPGTKT